MATPICSIGSSKSPASPPTQMPVDSVTDGIGRSALVRNDIPGVSSADTWGNSAKIPAVGATISRSSTDRSSPTGALAGAALGQTVLAKADRTPTLIFDEIDQGIGGRNKRDDNQLNVAESMAQWSRDHVPFPGALFRELMPDPSVLTAMDDAATRLAHAPDERLLALVGSKVGVSEALDPARRTLMARALGGYEVIHTTDAFFCYAQTAMRFARRHAIPLVWPSGKLLRGRPRPSAAPCSIPQSTVPVTRSR